MTLEEQTEYENAINRIVRGWIFWDADIIAENIPEWMSAEDYELIHKCIRVAHTVLREEKARLRKELEDASK